MRGRGGQKTTKLGLVWFGWGPGWGGYPEQGRSLRGRSPLINSGGSGGRSPHEQPKAASLTAARILDPSGQIITTSSRFGDLRLSL